MMSGGNLWLALDVGNTHTVAGLFDVHTDKMISRKRFRTDADVTPDEYRFFLSQIFGSQWNKITRVILSSVVPSLKQVVASAFTEDAIPRSVLSISSDTPRRFELDLPVPKELGADRLANVAGALALAKPPFLIVDAGTATTFCLIDSRPAYIGGAITPGLEISFKALQDRAAKLFGVEFKHPQSVIGNTTTTQLQSGLLFGYEALVEGLADRMLAECHWTNVTLLATGGCINYLSLSKRFRIEPDLTLIGLIEYAKCNKT